MNADLRKRIGLALQAGLLVSLALVAVERIIEPEFGSRLAGENSTTHPPTTPIQIEVAPTVIAGSQVGFRTCGIYFLSLTEKCLIDGDYRSQAVFFDRRVTLEHQPVPVPTPYP